MFILESAGGANTPKNALPFQTLKQVTYGYLISI